MKKSSEKCCLMIEKGSRVYARLFFETVLRNVCLVLVNNEGCVLVRGLLIFKQLIIDNNS